MDIGEDGIREPAQVDCSDTGEFFVPGFSYRTGELYASYPAYAPCLQGDGACN